MEDFSKLGTGSKIPPIANQVFKIQKKSKADDKDRQPKKESPEKKEKMEEDKKRLVDIKDTDLKEPEAHTEPEATEEGIGYQEHAKPKKMTNPKIDVVI
jgi:hypothetical protein